MFYLSIQRFKLVEIHLKRQDATAFSKKSVKFYNYIQILKKFSGTHSQKKKKSTFGNFSVIRQLHSDLDHKYDVSYQYCSNLLSNGIQIKTLCIISPQYVIQINFFGLLINRQFLESKNIILLLNYIYQNNIIELLYS